VFPSRELPDKPFGTTSGKLQSSLEGQAMSTNNQLWELRESATPVGQSAENWYAVLTRARHEKAAAYRLRRDHFLADCHRSASLERPEKDRRTAIVQLLFVRQADAWQRGAAASASDR
jgi:hypothetical protein